MLAGSDGVNAGPAALGLTPEVGAEPFLARLHGVLCSILTLRHGNSGQKLSAGVTKIGTA